MWAIDCSVLELQRHGESDDIVVGAASTARILKQGDHVKELIAGVQKRRLSSRPMRSIPELLDDGRRAV